MKLRFDKTEDNKIKVLIRNGESHIDFDYGEMIKQIYTDGQIEDFELNGDFSETEKQSIKELELSLKRAITKQDSNDEPTEEVCSESKTVRS